MNRQQNWEDLGRSIQDVVDRAVGSRDFQNMARNIRQVVESAAQAGGEAIRRTVQTPRVTVENLYGKTGGKVIGGILKTFFGGIFTVTLGLASIGGMILGEWMGVAGMALATLGSGLLLGSGIGTMKTMGRFRTYRKLLGQKTLCAVDKLARAVGKDVSFVRKDVTKMIGQGYFLEGHLDHEQNNLIISDDVYKEFEQARLQMEERKKQQAAQSPAALDPKVQEVLDRGNAFIARIRQCNDDIPGEAISAKIDRTELVVRRIFDRVRKQPEVVNDLRKLMNYYLPMTVKLLQAYADMDAQTIQGENIANSKREIEATLDTLNQAYEKLLDELFQDTALDISSDIGVLNAMLAMDGLTEDELTKMRKQNQ